MSRSVVFVHPAIHVCLTRRILGSMHGDSACEAIFSLLFLPLDPFPFLLYVGFVIGKDFGRRVFMKVGRK